MCFLPNPRACQLFILFSVRANVFLLPSARFDISPSSTPVILFDGMLFILLMEKLMSSLSYLVQEMMSRFSYDYQEMSIGFLPSLRVDFT